MRRLILGLAIVLSVATASAQGILRQASPLTGGCNLTGTLPVDAVPGVWTVAYGTCALTKKWFQGKLFDVTAFGSTHTIRAVNGYPDVKTLAGLMGISPAYGSGGLSISKWYDQSGNGNDATQGTAASQPVVWLVNGKVFTASDGVLSDYIDQAASNFDRYFNVPNTATFHNQLMSVYAVVQHGNSVAAASNSNYDSVIFSTSLSGTNSLTFWINAGLSATPFVQLANFDVGGSFAAHASGLLPESQPTVAAMIDSASATTFTQNEESGSSTAVAANTVTGGQIGGYPFFGISGGFFGRMQAVMVAGNTALTSGQQTTMRNSLYSLYGINKAPQINFVVDGASIDSAQGAIIGPTSPANVQGLGWVEQMQMFGQGMPAMRIINTSVTGTTLEDQNAKWATLQSTAFSSSFKKNIVFAGGLGAAGNSIGQGDTPAAAYNYLVNTYIPTVKAAGAWDAIFVATLVGEGVNANFAAYNALLRAGVPAGTILIDVPAYDAFTSIGCNGTATVYCNPSSALWGSHPTVPGYTAYLAPIRVAIRNALGF